MLLALRIDNFAIIESLEIELGPGFTVLTGETGAGKSILVDALTLVLGGRASADLIRTGADSAEVEALFDASDSPAAGHLLASTGLIQEKNEMAPAPEECEVVARRLVSRSGRNRVWINGKIESTGRLFEMGRTLVDIYGQHEYQTLLKEEMHRAILDSFGRLGEMVSDYRAAYDMWRDAEKELAALDMDESRKREREDMLRFRVSEIEAAGLAPGEDDELASEREIQRNADALKRASRSGVDYIYESDGCVLGGLRDLSNELRDASAHDPWLVAMAGQVDQAAASLEDVARELMSYSDRIEADPERLEWIEDRLHEIKGLKRKYGGAIDDVLAALEQAKDELSRLERRDEMLIELSRKVEASFDEARALASALTGARRKAAKGLSRRVEEELSSLDMEKTRFEVRIEQEKKAAGLLLGPFGADRVAFYISPNPGEAAKPLSRIASGGELSRIMLALRVLPVDEGDIASLVFDEVDAGIGGAVAEAVGRRMRSLSDNHQVLCVTHLPQIAALAHSHFLVVKHQDKDRTWVEVKKLSGEEKIEEIARMLGGMAITGATRAHAKEMLALAGSDEKDKKRGSGAGRKIKNTG